jgi:hypothetical protein
MSCLFIIIPAVLWALLILDVIVYIVVGMLRGPQFKHWPGSGFYCAWKHFIR